MTLRSLTVLAGTTALAVVLAVASSFTINSSSAVSERGKNLLPRLASQADEIMTIKIDDGKKPVELSRKGDVFFDTSGFPADMKPVRDLVTSLSTLRIEEKKTANKSRHGELELASPNAKDGAGKLVSILDKNNQLIASVIVGKSDYSVGGVSGGQYVRTAEADQSYLVRGTVKLPYGRSGWYDTNLYKVDEANIAKITLSDGATEQVVLTKADKKLEIGNLSSDKTADDAKINRLSALVESLDFEDVRKATSDQKPQGPVLTAETKDGLRLIVKTIDKSESGERWVRVLAIAVKDDVKKTVEKLNARTKGFDFQISSYQSDVFDWKLKDFEKKAES